MLEAALNAAAEGLLEWTAYGASLGRDGNRSPAAAPQGLYPCLGHGPETPRWLALSVESDAQWRALVERLGSPAWARAPGLEGLAGRRRAHGAIDAELRPWFAAREREGLVRELVAAGIPAAGLRDPRRAGEHPQHRARGFFEEVLHPVVGRVPIPGLPFRLGGVARWTRRPAPRMGEHNREILGELLGLRTQEIAALEAAGVLGSRPAGGG
jgi:crotonobetainyl-CoA:carnitine CoA-transferase CaiB-like acyl-CoA transferase